MENKNKPRVKAEASPVASEVKNWDCPDVKSICTKIDADDDCFMPSHYKSSNGSHMAGLFANLSEKEEDYTGEKYTRIPNRGFVQIDCGFSLDVSSGYKVRFSVNEELSGKGLFLVSPNQMTEGRVVLTLMNLGKEFMMIKNKDPIAIMWVEPVYSFEWV